MQINAASAVYPGVSHRAAMAFIAGGLEDPLLGRIGRQHVQLCPQHSGRITDETVDYLLATYPDTAFRLHATPRIEGPARHTILDAANIFEHPKQLRRMAEISRRLGAPAYSLHAGKLAHGTLADALENTRRLSDLFGCRVGIEGLYPAPGRKPVWILGTWKEHEQMLDSGVDFALDLSHLNIIARRERNERHDLVTDLMSSPHCIEIHLSDNDGRGDRHQPLGQQSAPWWIPFLPKAHPDCVVFYEGILKDPRAARRPN